jgi:hypothetical protein
MMAEVNKCSGCGAHVIHITTVHGKRARLEAEAVLVYLVDEARMTGGMVRAYAPQDCPKANHSMKGGD